MDLFTNTVSSSISTPKPIFNVVVIGVSGFAAGNVARKTSILGASFRPE